MSYRTATVIAVASGKGGVGKTNVAVNLSVALARLGHRVGLVDADFGLGNVDVLLGLTPEHTIGALLAGEASLDELLVEGPAGVRIVPASSGLRELTSFTPAQRAIVADLFVRLRRQFDFLLIDTAAGISDTVIDTILLADRVLVVTSLEPSAIVDAYATIKVLTAASPATEIGIVVNRVRSVEDAPQADATRCFRILAARLAGLAPVDSSMVKAPFARMAAVEAAAVQTGEGEVRPCE